ncbi:hypothetical protein GOBAR_DD26364 [Gossypium barbadense]|nr:hypothetical protein GOBAR_DD26364 [Gossypium barbadense]
MAIVEKTLADLFISEEEEVALPLGSKDSEGGVFYGNCFVGSFLTSSVINFQFMRSTLANVWHLIGSISISNLNEGHYLFRLMRIGLRLAMRRVSALFGYFSKNKTSSWSGTSLYGLQLVKNNVGWASSTGLRNRAFAGLIGALVQSQSIGLINVDRDEALLSNPTGRHENLMLECPEFGEFSDCMSPSACAEKS